MSRGRHGLVEHAGQATVRVGGVERDVGAARLQDAQQTDEHLGRASEAEADQHVGTRPRVPAGGGPAGPPARPARGTSGVCSPQDHRDRIGRPVCSLKELVDAHVRCGPRRRRIPIVEDAGDRSASVRAAGPRAARPGGRRSLRAGSGSAPSIRSIVGGVEQVGVVFERGDHAALVLRPRTLSGRTAPVRCSSATDSEGEFPARLIRGPASRSANAGQSLLVEPLAPSDRRTSPGRAASGSGRGPAGARIDQGERGTPGAPGRRAPPAGPGRGRPGTSGRPERSARIGSGLTK